MIPALVLTAGLATRLRPLSLVRAKAALPVGDQAIVQRILRWLAGYGVTDVVKREKPVAGPPRPEVVEALAACDFVLVGSAD